jgi:hypothetical protein
MVRLVKNLRGKSKKPARPTWWSAGSMALSEVDLPSFRTLTAAAPSVTRGRGRLDVQELCAGMSSTEIFL